MARGGPLPPPTPRSALISTAGCDSWQMIRTHDLQPTQLTRSSPADAHTEWPPAPLGRAPAFLHRPLAAFGGSRAPDCCPGFERLWIHTCSDSKRLGPSLVSTPAALTFRGLSILAASLPWQRLVIQRLSQCLLSLCSVSLSASPPPSACAAPHTHVCLHTQPRAVAGPPPPPGGAPPPAYNKMSSREQRNAPERGGRRPAPQLPPCQPSKALQSFSIPLPAFPH